MFNLNDEVLIKYKDISVRGIIAKEWGSYDRAKQHLDFLFISVSKDDIHLLDINRRFCPSNEDAIKYTQDGFDPPEDICMFYCDTYYEMTERVEKLYDPKTEIGKEAVECIKLINQINFDK